MRTKRTIPRRVSGEAPEVQAVLPPAFFDKPAEKLARDLLGTSIVRQNAVGLQRFIVSETEAYLGPHDLACHTARGRTARTEIMFGSPGSLYVYLVYGMHLMLNVVAGPPGAGAAVLIRCAGLVTGPGRLGKALALTMSLNGRIAAPEAGLWFETSRVVPRRIKATPRIGIDYAGPRWARRKLRFVCDIDEIRQP